MTWELYEVWSEVDGHEELIDTTKSRKEAIQLAKKAKLNHYSFDGIWVHWKGKMMPRIILMKKEKVKMN